LVFLQQKCIIEGLAGKTIILVTHQIEFLHNANTILVMRDGSIVQSGQFQELLSAGLDFESLVDAHYKSVDKVMTTTSGNTNPTTTTETTPSSLTETNFNPYLNSQLSRSGSERKPTNSSPPITFEKGPYGRSWRSLSGNRDILQLMEMEENLSRLGSKNDHENHTSQMADDNSSKLIVDEGRSTGRVGAKVYMLYVTAAYGGALALTVVVIGTIWQALLLAGDYWVAYETGGTGGTNGEQFDAHKFIVVYTVIAGACAVCVFGRAISVSFMAVITSQYFYLKMLRSVFRAPMAFFDTTPSGRILSRVSILSFLLLRMRVLLDYNPISFLLILGSLIYLSLRD
jgi:ATP-binding cassette subfamily C (CFTR/MRP) protein 2